MTEKLRFGWGSLNTFSPLTEERKNKIAELVVGAAEKFKDPKYATLGPIDVLHSGFNTYVTFFFALGVHARYIPPKKKVQTIGLNCILVECGDDCKLSSAIFHEFSHAYNKIKGVYLKNGKNIEEITAYTRQLSFLETIPDSAWFHPVVKKGEIRDCTEKLRRHEYLHQKELVGNSK